MSAKSIDVPGEGTLDSGTTVKSEGTITRRKFLQVLGAGTAVGVSGCADSPRQVILPNSQGSREQIPGVAVWYKTTCGECSAGCGLVVRTREGRAVKVEGNPEHPVNKGGVCALGQSTLQSLYDPDRVRQPVQRKRFGGGDEKRKGPVTDGEMKPVTWDVALGELAKALKKSNGKQALITSDISGTNAELVAEWCSALGVEHVAYELFSQAAEAKASEIVFGVYGVPTYNFVKADIILNFGADFLETWGSPVEHARDWADSRRGKAPTKFVHVEPRLSLTGANADSWLRSAPGSEEQLALLLIQMVAERRGAKDLSALPEAIRGKITAAIKQVSLESVVTATGISKDKILLLADDLSRAKNSLVIAGGAAAYTADALPLLVAVNALNLVLGNQDKTITVAQTRKTKSSAKALVALIERINKGEIENVIIWGTNPVFTLPSSFGLKNALRKVPTVFSLSSQLDESAAMAEYILPINDALESWGDGDAREGVYNLTQPTMLPLFDTKNGADILILAATQAGVTLKNKTFEDYLKARWANIHAASSEKGKAFDVFWRRAIGSGGYFEPATAPSVKATAGGEIKFLGATHIEKTPGASGKTLTLFPYPSVKSFDGRAANRPWLQELPDPITQASWSTWAEIHPETAKDIGLSQGDMVTLGNQYGEITVPVYISEYVHRDIVAVPIGQGHKDYGRYAKSVSGGSVLSLIVPKLDASESCVALVSSKVSVKRSLVKGSLPNAQGSDSQHNRELARTRLVAGAIAAEAGHHNEGHGEAHAAHDSYGHHEGAAHGAHHEPKQMYVQREHPLYQWGMAIDLAACTGCSACVVACYAENNIPVVGKEVIEQGREMAWLRIERYYEGTAEELKVDFLPMMCQHCQNAPCEPVCPVYATYHNEEGLNAMVYNRCVGTRYCSNNCSYKVRRFNWFEYQPPETLSWQLNPDVTKRSVGVMEKCTFCVQRINEAKDHAKDLGRAVEDGEVKPACVQSCPTKALTFGNLKDPNSKVSKISVDSRAYKVLDHHINTQPSVAYLEDIRVKA
jgi:molybdopterin-containing oxidoreductase family iron-sulfur binding subunit